MTSFNPQKDVATFMEMCGQEVNKVPTVPDKNILLLRARLLFEEVMEFIEAAGCKLSYRQKELETGELVDEFTVYEGRTNPDLVEMYDAICDIEYVNAGAANALGLNLGVGFEEVHRSNMSKVWSDGLIHKNEFGKVMKPHDTYSPADLKSIIDKETNNVKQT
jgi:predicted HAD superfamily Cof-like phosphohydrolase